MPKDSIVQVYYEDGVSKSEDDTYRNLFSQSSLFHVDGFHAVHYTAPASAAGLDMMTALHAVTVTLSDLELLRYSNNGKITQRNSMKPGDAFLWLANRPVNASWEKPLETLGFALDPAFLARSARERIDLDRLELLEQAHLRDPLFRGIATTIWEHTRNGGIDKIYGETLASTLAVHILRNYATVVPDLRPLAARLTNAELRRAVEYIHDNLDGDLSLAEIARVVGYSVHHFKRLFRTTIGKPVHQYVVEQRVAKAKTLLLRGELSIAEVAVLVGFYDQSHLHKHCKRLLGITPNALKGGKH